MSFTFAQLAAELTTDPKALGYAAMTAEQVAARLTLPGASGETLPQTNMQASDFWSAVVRADYLTLAQADRDLLRDYTAAGAFNPNAASVKAAITTMFTGKPTLTALNALLNRPASRAEVLWGQGAMVTAIDVLNARAGAP